ncbi:MAG: amino acid--tRNA ligase-related protein [Patescibacteria group bacterium]|nr:amino acid--tRNA ligase-related protein [Patescibacteria group bacterium]
MMTKKRTLVAETLTKVGQEVTVKGWVNTKRDHGKITFIDLRDRTGVVQVVGVNKLADLSVESVVEVSGLVKKRQDGYVNPDLKTGEIEIEASDYVIQNRCHELPITIDTDGKEINEVSRLRYRYLDLRRPRLQKILRLRSKFINKLREEFINQDFVEIETPLLTKSTKEGARDFIVPSRFQPGKFYALPQSPQQYKQLLMTAGFEKYFQVARCIRDEDLRADRGFEFTQFDLEMSFASQEEIMQTVEKAVISSVQAVDGKLKETSFPVFTYDQAMEEFGEDKFDLRSEKEKAENVLAFAWVVDFPFFKKVNKKDAAEVRDSKSGWTFTHNPFSMPKQQFLKDHLAQESVDQIMTTQYDLVCNGHEVGGGSLRAHQPDILKSTFKIMGYSDQQIEESVGHMLEAFKLGTPPHGGIALGLDRLVMLLNNEDSLKETVAFPMTSTGRTAVMDAPAKVEQEQLAEVGLQIKKQQSSVHNQIIEKLRDQGADFKYMSHQDVFTSKEAAKVRGTDLKQSAKALVLQADKEFILLVLPGDQRADLEKMAQMVGAKRLAMASKDSVKSKVGLEVGSIPPLGSIMDLKTYLDKSLESETEIAFNVGRHDRSVTMSVLDFIRLEKPTILDFSS